MQLPAGCQDDVRALDIQKNVFRKRRGGGQLFDIALKLHGADQRFRVGGRGGLQGELSKFFAGAERIHIVLDICEGMIDNQRRLIKDGFQRFFFVFIGDAHDSCVDKKAHGENQHQNADGVSNQSAMCDGIQTAGSLHEQNAPRAQHIFGRSFHGK